MQQHRTVQMHYVVEWLLWLLCLSLEPSIAKQFTWKFAQVLEKETAALNAAGLECECLGGGYIIHLPDTKELKVYGNSQTYGQADHEKTTEILKKQYPTYTSVTWSNEAIV